MTFRTILLATAGVATLGGGSAAIAAPKHRAASSGGDRELMEQVRALREQVEALQARIDQQGQNQAETTAVATAAKAQADTANQAAAAQQAQVQTQLAQQSADVQKQLDKAAHPDKINFKGITITPGGYLELAGIYRSRFQGDDIASSFAIPFPGQSHPSHVSEGRFSARQSRLSVLAEGKPNANTTLAMYGEFDFQGAAQTSNSNQSNSYVPRIRNLYGTIDWNRGDYGLHFLAGQNWSLLTMNGKGITPRNEVTPPQIDAQYVPGFFWARQPGIRLTGDFLDHHLWIAASAENPQTTFGGTSAPTGVVAAVNGQGLGGATGTITCPQPNSPASACTVTIGSTTQAAPSGSFQQFYNGVGSSLSLNHVPDFIGKVAYETVIAGHALHVEGFGIYRTFSEHFDGTQSNGSAHSFGYGGSVALQVVPKLLDVQFSGIGGRGIGRYGSAGLPDVTFDREGEIHPIREFMLLAGATLHATPKLDIYGFAGEEQEYRKLFDGGATGLGLPTANNTGCFTEAPTTLGSSTCAGNTRRIRQVTAGAWDKIYQGSFGRAQVGVQYSYTQRQLFEGVGGMPQTHNNMVFVSFRYYPF
ncbi:hypothetical protein [Sphingomonas sp.]|uniref:hypothetical protein n=1 Tax=Sphingomonas sp. TaxID=28214 RepID=UPI003B0044B1